MCGSQIGDSLARCRSGGSQGTQRARHCPHDCPFSGALHLMSESLVMSVDLKVVLSPYSYFHLTRGIFGSLSKGCVTRTLYFPSVSLRSFSCLPFLQGLRVLVWTDNTIVAYINQQGGMHSHRTDPFVQRSLFVSSSNACPGIADMLSRSTLVYREWSLDPAVVEQIWARFFEGQWICSRQGRKHSVCYSFPRNVWMYPWE